MKGSKKCISKMLLLFDTKSIMLSFLGNILFKNIKKEKKKGTVSHIDLTNKNSSRP